MMKIEKEEEMTNAHLIQWDNDGGVFVTAHVTAEAAEEYFRKAQNIPDGIPIEQFHDMRDFLKEDGGEVPDWMNIDDDSYIIGQLDILGGEGDEKPLDVEPRTTVVELADGKIIRCPAHPAPCDSVTVYDKEGNEIVHFDIQEWIDDPAYVMGAIMGAMKT